MYLNLHCNLISEFSIQIFLHTSKTFLENYVTPRIYHLDLVLVNIGLIFQSSSPLGRKNTRPRAGFTKLMGKNMELAIKSIICWSCLLSFYQPSCSTIFIRMLHWDSVILLSLFVIWWHTSASVFSTASQYIRQHLWLL